MKQPARISVPVGYKNSASGVELDEEKVRRRAYELYEKRGRENGHDIDDWLQAKSEVARTENKPAAA
jgi:hypothetical protein